MTSLWRKNWTHIRRKEQINKQEKEAGVKYVKTLVEKHNSQKVRVQIPISDWSFQHQISLVKNGHFWSKIQAQLEAKIKTLEDAFDRDKENRQDYLEIQHRRKLKIKDQEINSLKEELKTNKEQIWISHSDWSRARGQRHLASINLKARLHPDFLRIWKRMLWTKSKRM